MRHMLIGYRRDDGALDSCEEAAITPELRALFAPTDPLGMGSYPVPEEIARRAWGECDFPEGLDWMLEPYREG